MTKVDKDGSGAIDQEEFTALMAEQIENRDQYQELGKTFRIYDDDDNGLISAENLIRCGKDLEEPVTSHEVGEMIRMGDKSHNNGVNKDDFMDLMRELGLWGKKKSEMSVEEIDIDNTELKV